MLFNLGYKTFEDIKHAEPKQLVKILGPAIAKKVKEQTGEEIDKAEWKNLSKTINEKKEKQKSLTEF